MINNLSSDGIDFPNQRVSLSKKQSNAWTKSMADYVLQLAFSYNNKRETLELLDMANGIVPKNMYEYVLKTFGIKGEDKQAERLIDDLREIDILQPIKDKYLGEFTSAYNNYQIYSDDPNTVVERNLDFGKKVLANMQQLLINELNAQNINTGEQSKEIPDISKLLAEHIKEWDAKRVDGAQKRLNLLNNEIDAKLKYNQLYYYWWATEECYTFRKVHKDNVMFEVVPSQEYYRVPSGNTFVEDDEYGVRICRKSIYQILDEYSDLLTKADLEFIKKISTSDKSVIGNRIELLKSRLLENGMSSEDLLSNANSLASAENHSEFVNIDKLNFAHYVFKTETKVGYLTFVNEVGEIEQKIVDESYEFDGNGGDISLEWDWVQQMYQGEIIGYNASSNINLEAIYTKVRPVDIQRETFTNLNIVKSPYNGISFIVKDSARKPIPYRVNPYLALIRIYHYQIERAIYKWKSLLAIPASMLSDDSEMSMEQRLSKMQGESLLIYNDTIVNPQLLNGLKEVATTATYNYVQTVQGLIQSLKAEAKEVANMTPSREGSQAAYQGKSVTEDSLMQGQISSNWYLEMFNLFRGRDYLANYDYSKIAWIDGKQGSFIDDTTGEVHFVDVDIEEHFGTNIGINVGNSKILDEKLKAIKDIAFSASQNGDTDQALEAVTNDNLQSLKGKIEEMNKAKRDYDMQMKQAEQQAQAQVEQLKNEGLKQKLDGELQLAQLKADSSKEIAYINQETQLLIWEKRLQIDKDGNGYISEQDLNDTMNVDKVNKEQAELGMKLEHLQLERDKFEHSKKKDNAKK